jgi:caffeoyl-CoA O-methyltransferase
MAREAYIESLFADRAAENDEILESILETIRSSGMPEISINPGYGRLLTLLVATAQAKAVLEIGALGGYSGVCLARGLPSDGSLVSLELKAEYAQLAHSNMTKAGYGDQVTYIVGEALVSLERLGQEQRKFDFIFIDADKENYPLYLEWALQLGNPGALIVADNILLRDRVMEAAHSSPSVMAMRRFNERIVSEPRLQSVLLPAYDGLAIARIR